MHANLLPGRTRTSFAPALLLSGTFMLGLTACGVEEASTMTKFANEMCACKDIACAEKLFPQVEAESKKNEGKEVVAAAADKYNAELARLEKCVEKLQADADKAEAEQQ